MSNEMSHYDQRCIIIAVRTFKLGLPVGVLLRTEGVLGTESRRRRTSGTGGIF